MSAVASTSSSIPFAKAFAASMQHEGGDANCVSMVNRMESTEWK